MRIVVRLVFGVLAGASFLLASPGIADAQYTSSVSLKPSSGPAGSPFTISWNFYPCKGAVSFSWNGTPMWSASADPQTISGTVAAQVPGDAQPGTYPVTGTCTNARTGGPLSAGSTFTVTGTTTTTPPPSTKTVPPTTILPSLPAGTSSTPPTTTSTSTSSSTATSTTTSETPLPTSASTEVPAGELGFDRPAVRPGEPLSASGKGCEPGRMVRLTSDGDEVGTTYSDATGSFTAAVAFTRIEAGPHTVVADCGVRLTGSVEQVVTNSSGGHSSTLVILVFFVLAGIAVVRFR